MTVAILPSIQNAGLWLDGLVTKKKLTPEKRKHCGDVEAKVREFAAKLGVSNQDEVDRIALAALLHDCAVDLPAEEQLQIAADNGITIYGQDKIAPVKFLHARVGAVLAKLGLGIEDEEISQGIGAHTHGEPNLPRLGRLVTSADDAVVGRDEDQINQITKAIGAEGLDPDTRLDIAYKLAFAFKLEQQGEYVRKKLKQQRKSPVELVSMKPDIGLHPLFVRTWNSLFL